MRIDEIYIDGYRKFNKGTINLEHGNFAILAGANNSGKTSLIQLLDFVFNNSSRRSLTFNDFSIELKAFLNKKIKFICLKTELFDFQVRTPLDKMRIIFNNKLVRSTLTAYKLFYVGCSRAEEELVVLIDSNNIENMEEFKNCFKHLGFDYD